MIMKINITKEVYTDEYADIPEKPDEFLAFWKDKIDRIPEEYRDSATIEVKGVDNYGDPGVKVTVSYVRPETDEEEDRRKRGNQETKDSIERRELEELRRLTKKYNCGK